MQYDAMNEYVEYRSCMKRQCLQLIDSCGELSHFHAISCLHDTVMSRVAFEHLMEIFSLKNSSWTVTRRENAVDRTE